MRETERDKDRNKRTNQKQTLQHKHIGKHIIYDSLLYVTHTVSEQKPSKTPQNTNLRISHHPYPNTIHYNDRKIGQLVADVEGVKRMGAVGGCVDPTTSSNPSDMKT